MFHDPYIEQIPKLRNYDFSGKKSISLNKKNLELFDFVILVTDHDVINFKDLKKYSKIIFDTRNKLKSNSKNVYHL